MKATAMGSLTLNKSSLKAERDRLKTYQRFLPSLDLKRQQLMVEFKKTQKILGEDRREIEAFTDSLEQLLALLGAATIEPPYYVTVQTVDIAEENVVGVKLPVLQGVEYGVETYSTLARPFWVDTLVACQQKMIELRVCEQIDQERASRLSEAVRKITQRVNLFEKVLIPNTRKNIHRICIFLGDAERAAVVRSKIVKTKRQHQTRPLEYD